MSKLRENVLASLSSAILISLFFTLWNDFIYRRQNVTGYWAMIVTYEITEKDDFKQMEVYYDIVLSQHGNRIVGKGEKTGEKELGKKIKKYERKHSAILEVQGGVTYKFLSANRINIYYTEKNPTGMNDPLESASLLELEQVNENQSKGKFRTTISNAEGKVSLKRKPAGG